MHLPTAEVVLEQISGRDLSTVYSVAIDSFQGSNLGAPGLAPSHMPATPRFAIEGRVLTGDGEPIRGAAVEAGAQTVYTDSEGRFLARFPNEKPVRIALAPAAFLTAVLYRSVTAPQVMPPQRDGAGNILELRAERCLSCEREETAAAPSVEEPTHGVPVRRSAFSQLKTRIFSLAARMAGLRGSIRQGIAMEPSRPS